MQFKAVCFDLDGTLLNSLADITYCANKILEDRGLPSHSLETIKSFIGDGVKSLITKSLPQAKRDIKTIQNCQNDFEETYRKNCWKNTIPYNGISRLLDELRAKNIKLSILSNKPQEFTSQIVEHLLQNWEFDSVLGQSDMIPKKPSPEGFFIIRKKLQLPSKSFIFLGDSGTDMKTAVAAGCYPVGAQWGFRCEKELRDNGAKLIIKKPLELLDIIN